jgi:membrane associated rhomboid family serine protease
MRSLSFLGFLAILLVESQSVVGLPGNSLNLSFISVRRHPATRVPWFSNCRAWGIAKKTQQSGDLIVKTTPTNVLIGANVVIFLITTFVAPKLKYHLMKVDSLILHRGETYRLFTACFAHADLMHIGFNMYSLQNLGPAVERIFGTPRFVNIYLASGFLGNLVTLLLGTSPRSLGASGAVFGLLGALATHYYRNRKVLAEADSGREPLNHTLPIAHESFLQVLAQLKRQLLYSALIAVGGAGSGVDHYGHFGGCLGKESIPCLCTSHLYNLIGKL